MAPDVDNCGNCEEKLKNNDKIVKCAFCLKKHHIICVGIGALQYSNFSSLKNVFFKCDKCEISFKVYEHIEEKLELFESMMLKLNNIEQIVMENREKIHKNSSEMAEVKKSIQKKCQQTDSCNNTNTNVLVQQKGTYAQQLACSIGDSSKTKKMKKKNLGDINNVESPHCSNDVDSRSKTIKRDTSIVYVKPTNPDVTIEMTKNEIKKIIDIKTDPVKGIIVKRNEKIAVLCKDSESVQKIEDKLSKGLKKDWTVFIAEKKWPLIAICGVDQDDFANTGRFVQELRLRNDDLNDAKINFVKIQKGRNETRNVILECDIPTFERMMNKKKVSIGWSVCNVYEYVNVLQCFKCNKYGHIAKECNHEKVCSKCNGQHDPSECVADKFICGNCVAYNERLKESETKLATDHPVFSIKCPIYKQKYVERKKIVKYYD